MFPSRDADFAFTAGQWMTEASTIRQTVLLSLLTGEYNTARRGLRRLTHGNNRYPRQRYAIWCISKFVWPSIQTGRLQMVLKRHGQRRRTCTRTNRTP